MCCLEIPPPPAAQSLYLQEEDKETSGSMERGERGGAGREEEAIRERD